MTRSINGKYWKLFSKKAARIRLSGKGTDWINVEQLPVHAESVKRGAFRRRVPCMPHRGPWRHALDERGKPLCGSQNVSRGLPWKEAHPTCPKCFTAWADRGMPYILRDRKVAS